MAKSKMNHLNNTLLTRFFAVLLLILIVIPAFSQESVLTASENASGDGGTISYSVGQVAFHTLEGALGTLTEGVQQPYEILFMTGVPDETISLKCIVYPNPTVAGVVLSMEMPMIDKCKFLVRGSSGILYMEATIDNRETTVPLDDLAPGTYMITIVRENAEQLTWKIIKQ
jgi:hypothetical protein